MRRYLISGSVGLVTVLLLSSSAFAQQQPAPREQLQGYLIGGAGSSTSPQSTFVVSAEIAESIPMNMQVYLTIGYYDDVMTDTARAAIAESSAVATALTGNVWQFSGRDKARSVSVGLKYLVPTASGIR